VHHEALATGSDAVRGFTPCPLWVQRREATAAQQPIIVRQQAVDEPVCTCSLRLSTICSAQASAHNSVGGCFCIWKAVRHHQRRILCIERNGCGGSFEEFGAGTGTLGEAGERVRSALKGDQPDGP